MARKRTTITAPVGFPPPAPPIVPDPVEPMAAPAAAGPRTAMQPIPTMGYVVTEADPMKGVSPLPPVYFDVQQEAIDYGITRIPLFGRVEVSLVLYRAITELVPQTRIDAATEEPQV